jgi:hypothetical protein
MSGKVDLVQLRKQVRERIGLKVLSVSHNYNPGWEPLDIQKFKTKKQAGEYKATKTKIILTGLPAIPTKYSIGVDPATVNLSICILKPEVQGTVGFIYDLSLFRYPRNPVERIKQARRVLEKILVAEHKYLYKASRKTCIIEGASFGSTHRQVELAEQRAALVVEMLAWDCNPEVVPPTTIRKQALGHGKLNGKTLWKEEGINENGGDALVCVLYGLGLTS